jgi:hypothetical protein
LNNFSAICARERRAGNLFVMDLGTEKYVHKRDEKIKKCEATTKREMCVNKQEFSDKDKVHNKGREMEKITCIFRELYFEGGNNKSNNESRENQNLKEVNKQVNNYKHGETQEKLNEVDINTRL